MYFFPAPGNIDHVNDFHHAAAVHFGMCRTPMSGWDGIELVTGGPAGAGSSAVVS
jgi:hypothetical protein